MRTFRCIVGADCLTTGTPNLFREAGVPSDVVVDDAAAEVVKIGRVFHASRPQHAEQQVDVFNRDDFDGEEWEHHQRPFQLFGLKNMRRPFPHSFLQTVSLEL